MKYLRRLVWHIASRLLVVCLVLGLMVVAFYYAMNVTNIYIVLKDVHRNTGASPGSSRRYSFSSASTR